MCRLTSWVFLLLFAFTASMYFTGLVIYSFSKRDQSLDMTYKTRDVLQIPGRQKVLSDTFKADQKLFEILVDVLQAVLGRCTTGFQACHQAFVEHHSKRGIWWDPEHKDFEKSTGTAHGKCGSPCIG